MKSLFGHIVMGFTSQAENLATEGLNYIISNSFDAKNGLFKFLNIIDNDLDNFLYFKTQDYGEDNSIPDLVGLDADGDSIVIIESKFWAGLTENQPVTYLKRLNPEKPSILLFLVPSRRLETIWFELKNRCEDEGINLNDENRENSYINAKLSDKNYLAVTDWITLLNFIETQLDKNGDYVTKADLIQLKGLCEQMDEETFLPIDSQEISPMIARRNVDFCDIVDQVVTTGVAKGIFTSKGCRSAGGLYYYGRYFLISDNYYFIQFNNQNWYEVQNTPFWLICYGKELYGTSERPKIKKALVKLELDEKLYFTNDDASLIPLKLELGVDKTFIIESFIKQIAEISELLEENYE